MRRFFISTLFFSICAALVIFSACTPSENSVNQRNNQEIAAPADNNSAAPEKVQEEAKAAVPDSKNAEPARDEAAFAKLLNPDEFKDIAPDQFNVIVKTTKGDVKIELHRDWAPNGVDRFYNLVKGGFFNDIALFRMVKGFVVQFGIHGSPLVSGAWREAIIKDDPVRETNAKGTLTFATAGRDTRTTQLFINLQDNKRLDQMGFSPIGKIVEGMDVIENLNFEYGERPNQGRIQSQGNAYLKTQFPNLDYIVSMTIE